MKRATVVFCMWQSGYLSKLQLMLLALLMRTDFTTLYYVMLWRAQRMEMLQDYTVPVLEAMCWKLAGYCTSVGSNMLSLLYNHQESRMHLTKKLRIGVLVHLAVQGD